MKHILFVCGRNRKRSPTAEILFRDHPGVAVQSAGLSPDADTPLDREMVEWADVIFVMEASQRRKINAQFGRSLKDVRLVCLDIPDRFEFMDPQLQELLKEKVGPLLG
jgi:predicted protein tyrosine phosphatase